MSVSDFLQMSKICMKNVMSKINNNKNIIFIYNQGKGSKKARKMANGEYRHVWRIVFRNFINSLRPRNTQTNNVGKDYIGNQYYEVPADPSVGKRKPSRWYDPPKGLDFQEPIPAEWEAWLRMRRKDPPTEEEIAQNLAIAEMKKINAANIEAKRLAEGGSLPTIPEKGPDSFPTYKEYHGGDPNDQYKK